MYWNVLELLLLGHAPVLVDLLGRARGGAGEIDEAEYHERMAVLGGGRRRDRKTNAAV
jgi:hypothetical protein